MLHIFVDPSQMQGDMLTIEGSDVNHIKNVLRMKCGEEISVSNGQDQCDYRYGIEEIREDEIFCRLRFVKEADVELPVRVYLFQGLPKSDKMELIVQKAVELGVAQIIPVEMKRCVMKLDGPRKKKKTQRWQTIAEAAAKQSKRGMIPVVNEPMTMKEAIEFATANTTVQFLPYELQEDEGMTHAALSALKPGDSVSFFIGPEGGFEPDEVALAKEKGIVPISLGRRILRTETAAMVFLSWLIYRFEIG